jgi:hypothetical protein
VFHKFLLLGGKRIRLGNLSMLDNRRDIQVTKLHNEYLHGVNKKCTNLGGKIVRKHKLGNQEVHGDVML